MHGAFLASTNPGRSELCLICSAFLQRFSACLFFFPPIVSCLCSSVQGHSDEGTVLQAGARVMGGITGVGLQIFQGSASARHREERQGSLHRLNRDLQALLCTPNHPNPEGATAFEGEKGKREKKNPAAGRICNCNSCSHTPQQGAGCPQPGSQGACSSGPQAGLALE